MAYNSLFQEGGQMLALNSPAGRNPAPSARPSPPSRVTICREMLQLPRPHLSARQTVPNDANARHPRENCKTKPTRAPHGATPRNIPTRKIQNEPNPKPFAFCLLPFAFFLSL